MHHIISSLISSSSRPILVRAFAISITLALVSRNFFYQDKVLDLDNFMNLHPGGKNTYKLSKQRYNKYYLYCLQDSMSLTNFNITTLKKCALIGCSKSCGYSQPTRVHYFSLV